MDLISSIDQLLRETKINYDLFKEVFHHSTDPIDMKKARLILLVQQWKLKVCALSLFAIMELFEYEGGFCRLIFGDKWSWLTSNII